MSEIFFEELGVPEPDHMLGVGSGTHARADGAGARAARAGAARRAPGPRARPRRRQLDPRGGAVRGAAAGSPSATSSPGCAASTARCRRRSTGSSPTTSPSCSSLHSPEAEDNLRAEGDRPARATQFVGNTMIDTLVALEERFRAPRGAPRRSASSRAPTCWSPCTARRSSTARCSPTRSPRSERVGERDAGRLPGPSADPQDARRRGRRRA